MLPEAIRHIDTVQNAAVGVNRFRIYCMLFQRAFDSSVCLGLRAYINAANYIDHTSASVGFILAFAFLDLGFTALREKRTATLSCRTQKRAFHFYSPDVVLLRFTILGAESDWHELMIPQCIIWPTIARSNGPAVQPAVIPFPQSATPGLHSVGHTGWVCY